MNKFVIIVTTKPYINELNGLIDNLNKFFIKSNPFVDLLIFIEKKDIWMKDQLIKYNGNNIILHIVDNFDINYIDKRFHKEISDSVMGFSIPYRQMGRFYAGEVFKILKTQYDYDYYIKLDTDSRFYDNIRDLFEEFINKNSIYGYVSIVNEPPEFSNLLAYEIKKYIEKNKIPCNEYFLKHMDNLSFVYYSNFEMGKVSEFVSNNHLNLYNYLDNVNGFMKYRWGDHLFRFFYVNLFVNEKYIHYFDNLSYFHKYDLKNKPFQFIDWKLDEFRENSIK